MPSIVANSMKSLRKFKGLGIKDLMKLTGYSRATISRHFRGVRAPNYEQRQKYADILGVLKADIDAIYALDPSIPVDQPDSTKIVNASQGRDTAILAWFARLPPPVQADILGERAITVDTARAASRAVSDLLLGMTGMKIAADDKGIDEPGEKGKKK